MRMSRQYVFINGWLGLFHLGAMACGTSSKQKPEARNQTSESKDVYSLVVTPDGNATLQKQEKAEPTDVAAREEKKDSVLQKAWDFFDSNCVSRVTKEIDFDTFDPSSLQNPIIFEGPLPAGTTPSRDGIQIKGKLKVTELVEKAPLSKECKEAKEQFQK